MEGIDDTWTCNATEAIEISLVKPSSAGLKTISSFPPSFTYTIFENEQIFGYKNLKVGLKYHASDMRPHFDIYYSKKFATIGSEPLVDVKEELEKFLPEVAFQKGSEFERAIKQVPEDWSPPGQRIKEFDGKDGKYEVWQGTLADPAVQQLVTRIQFMIPLFIEGGTLIGTDDSDSLDRWTVFFLFCRKDQLSQAGGQSSYEFAGYSTVYRFFHYKRSRNDVAKLTISDSFELPKGDFSLAELPCRSRISQFLILPPYQGKGNASQLYNTIYDVYLQHPQTIELTVEDPNEAFDDLRDLSDYAFLLNDPAFSNLRVDSSVTIPKKGPAPRNIVDQSKLEELRLRYKIAPRQFSRVVELHLMATLPDTVRYGFDEKVAKTASKEQKHEYSLWKMLVKQRLYRHNKDTLGQLDRNERIDKLEEALRSVESGYARLLDMHDRRSKHAEPSTNGKRKLADSSAESASKKARVSEA